tara:strand:+ start:15949 stop:16377 length:429 start_codon:yes stop_codon:yes gene_type:complete
MQTQNHEKSPVIFNIDKSFTEEDIETILVSGFEGGIGYWAVLLDLEEPENVPERLSKMGKWYRAILAGGHVTIADTEEHYRAGGDVSKIQTWRLDLDALKRGLEACRSHEYTWRNAQDAWNIDADVADNIIQFALFGELVYG